MYNDNADNRRISFDLLRKIRKLVILFITF